MTTAPSPRPMAARHRSWPWCRQCTGIALDLGSARTRAWTSGRRMILDVPTVTFPGTGAMYPIQRGAIVDTPERPGCSTGCSATACPASAARCSS